MPQAAWTIFTLFKLPHNTALAVISMKHINRNFPWCDEYSDNSFTGIFHEKQIWNDEEYFLLENEIYDLTSRLKDTESIQREAAWRIMRIFSYLMMSLGCHSNPDDGFKIKNMSSEEHRSRVERLQFVFEGFFRGEMPNKEYLEY